MADPGSVGYLFDRKGVVIVKKENNGKVLTEDLILDSVLEAGAEDVNDIGDSYEIVSAPTDLVAIKEALKKSNFEYESADTSFLPSVSIPIEGETAKGVLELIDAIEDLDDVQNVYGNFDISDEVMASLT